MSIILAPIDLPIIRAGPVDVNVTLSSNASFNCQAAAVPPITGYQWFFNNTLIPSSPRYVVRGSSLFIISATLADIGYYKCQVSNLVGDSISKQALLTVLRKQAIIRNLCCSIFIS